MTKPSHIVPILLISICVLFAFGDVLSGTSILSFRDHMDVFRPTFQFLTEHLQDGRLPFGPMHSQMGTALETQLNGTYTPLTLIFFLMPFDTAYDWYVLAHFLLLSFGAYGFARNLNASAQASLAAAVFCGLAGPVLSTENLLSAAHGLAFAPWVYWTLDVLIRKPSFRSTALFAIALGFQVQGAIPIILLMNVLVGLCLFFHRRKHLNIQATVFGAVALVLAFGLAAIEIGGVLEYLPLSRRGQGFDYPEASRWSVSFGQLLEFVVPSMWWTPDKTYLLNSNALASEMPPYFISLYLGCTIPLAFGACAANRGKRKFWLIAIFAFLLIAMGPVSPLHYGMTKLPLLSSSRFPVKYTLILVPILAYLLARSFDDISSLSPSYLICCLAYLGLCICLLLVFGMEEVHTVVGKTFTPHSIEALPIGITASDYQNAFIEAIKSRIWHALIFSVISTLFVAYAVSQPQLHSSWVKWGLCLVIILDISLAARFTIFGAPTQPNAPSEKTMSAISGDEHLVFIATPRGRRAAFHPDSTQTEFASSILSANQRGHNAHHRLRYLRDIDRNGLSPEASRLALDTLKTSNLKQAVNVMKRSGTQWMGTYTNGLFPNPLVDQIENAKSQNFYRIADARGYVAHHFEWRYLDLEKVSTADQPRFIQGLEPEQAFVTAPLEMTTQPSCTSSVATASATITYSREPKMHKVTIQSDSPCPRLLSILETNMPNWKVYVDEKPSSVWTIDFGQIGTYLEPGPHTVRIQYEASSEKWAQTSAVSWVIALILLFIPQRKKSIFS